MILSFTTVEAQNYTLSKSSEIKVSGTSSLHDWIMTAERVNGEGSLIIENNEIKEATDLKVVIGVESLKSGKSGMDENAYKAMNSKKHKNITFNLTSLTPAAGNKMTATGKLTINGVTKTIKINTTYKIDSNGTVTFSGAVPFKMSEYSVEPPTAMFGTIKTGDEITINFNTEFVQDNKSTNL